MLWLDEQNAQRYLRETGHLDPSARVRVEVLSGGVSNQVLYISLLEGDGTDFVLKQARPQLRTPAPWFSSVERAWREVEVLHVCQQVLEEQSAAHDTRPATTPRVLFEDRENYAFAMTAAPREHVVWKQQLLAGQVDEQIAAECGRLLAALHRGTWDDPGVAARLKDRQLFEELRLDPYYRTVAQRDAEAADLMRRLIASVWDHPRSLVHADFSPKNLLVSRDGLMMVDFETGHFGDPAFDLGFFLSHLVLKAFYHAGRHEPYLRLTEIFWESYAYGMQRAAAKAPPIEDPEYSALVLRGIANFAGCAWARLDGKSRVEYLLQSPWRDIIRDVCRQILRQPPASWAEVLLHCRSRLAA